MDPVRLFLGHVAARAGGSRLRWPPVVRFVPPLLVLAVFGAATTARANPEPPYAYDARVAGMGGAASAVTENATGLFHNPAQLDAIERFSVTAVITSLLVNLRAPFAGPGSEQDSGIQYAPLLFVGGVGRVHERVTLGLGAYVYTGFGGGYRTVDCIAYDDPTVCDDPDYPGRLEPAQSQEVALFIAEAALPVQVTVTKWLSVGVTLRMPWGRQTVTATQETTNGNENTLFFGRATQQISGFGIPGVLLGVSVRPPQVEGLTLALAYRSKVWVDMEGTTEAQLGLIGGEPRTLEVPTTTRWYVPHMVRVGVAYRTWHDRLTISGDFKVQFHEEANQAQVFGLDSPFTPDTKAQFDWRNAMVGALGLEIYARPRFPLRVGVSMARSASNPDTLTPFSPPPGIQYGVYGGFGIDVDPIDIDLAAGWGGGPAYQRSDAAPLCTPVDPSRVEGRSSSRTVTTSGGCPGSYDVDSWFISFSATYSM